MQFIKQILLFFSVLNSSEPGHFISRFSLRHDTMILTNCDTFLTMLSC